jgi:fucose permease
MVSGALIVGMVLSLLASLRPALARSLGRDEASTGGPRLVFLATLVPSFLVSGLLVDWLGPQEGMILGSLGTAICLASLGLNRTYLAVLAAAAGLGAAAALLHTATVLLMPPVFEALGRPTTSATNLGYLIMGLSALVMSHVLPLLEKKTGLRQGLLLLALVSLVPAAAAGLAPEAPFHNGGRAAGVGEILSDPWLWLAGLLLLLYAPLESAATTWAPEYLVEAGRSPRGVGVVLLGFSVAFLGGRFLVALLPPLLVPWAVLFLLLLAAADVGNLMGVFRPAGATFGVWVFGACLGPVLPSLVGMTLGRPQGHRGAAFGLLLALGSAGGLVVEPAVAWFARGRPVRYTMRLVMLVALLLAAPALVLCLMDATR